MADWHPTHQAGSTTEPRRLKKNRCAPGIWSTDDYIRDWAISQGMNEGECLIPLQSLHGYWMARVNFNQSARPVERFTEDPDTE